MIFTVIITPDAEQEMEDAYLWLLPQTDQHAPLWYNGLIEAILSLENMPGRCPLAPESAAVNAEEIRQLLYGTPPHLYRILFSIRSETVVILHVRHAARNPS
jgi:plasmid stabilization system protein ParE